MYLMNSYDSALVEILENGVKRTNQRTGITTTSVFGMLRRYKLDTDYFPIVTRRKLWPTSVFGELLWFLTGSTNNKHLIERHKCKFWTPWVDHAFEQKHGYTEGSFGPVYGFQLRHFGGDYNSGQEGDGYGQGGFDQLKWVVERIKEDPSCRRTLWTLWNPQDVHKMKLPPCHMMSQIFVDDERRLTLLMYQRSCDFPVGVPANIQFYSALAKMIAQQTDCVAHEFVHVTGDSHIYADQMDGVREYLETPKIDSPKLAIKKAADIFSYELDDFSLTDFVSGPKIEIPVAV